MIITVNEMQDRLRSIFPNVLDWLPTDREYLTIEPADVYRLMKRYADSDNRYIPRMYACEEIAMAFVVDVRRGRLDKIEDIPVHERLNYAIGEALGTVWDGIKRSHHANIFFAKDNIYLFDMQTLKIRKAKKGRDDIFFVKV